jgi:hypothetical protein
MTFWVVNTAVPVVPVFSFSGAWQSAFVMASAVPFIVSLTWRNAKLVSNA